ncbi:MAG: sodium/proline symporter [Planctomycetota bacterium]
MENPAILLTLLAYLIGLLGIGFWASGRNADEADYFLGGRNLGAWVASISSAASSSSAWTLLGVSGAAYTFGFGAIWILPACLGGFALNWFLLARPLWALAARTGGVTVIDLLARKPDGGRSRGISRLASLIVLLSLGGYVASQFQGAGKALAGTFPGLEPSVGILCGVGVILLYTLMGGFWAVSVTDLVQGLVMAAASLLVPAAALVAVGGPARLMEGLEGIDAVLTDPLRGLAPSAAAGMVLGTLGIGLGYPGQPHVVNRFMALKDEAALVRGRRIAMTWAVVTYSGMLLAGWCGRVLFQEASVGDSEQVLVQLSTRLFPPAMAGILVAAVLSAIMSTADSQLLVCGSTVAHDLPRESLSGRAGLRRGRLSVVILCLLAAVAALWVRETIFNLVLFAWSGLGAAFGPLLLVRCLRGPVRAGYALASMSLGFLVSVIWFFTPELKGLIYELVPAFFLAFVPAWVGAGKGRGSPRVSPGNPDRS